MMTSDHVAGAPAQTTGSSQRPSHRLARPVLTFDLAAEVERLQQEESWRHGQRNAKTLVKEPDFRVVLVALQSGAGLEEHSAPGRISIHTVQGHIRVHVHDPVNDQVVDLPTGHILTLEQSIAHNVEALDDCAFLLTIAWPTRAGTAVTAIDEAT